MKKILSFLGKVLLGLVIVALLALGALQMLKDKAEETGGNDSIAELHKNDWVDLGLPSGLLWAKFNIGSTSDWDTSYLYAWGDSKSKEYFRWRNYRWTEGDRTPTDSVIKHPGRYDSGPGDHGKLLKYCTNPNYGKDGLVDNLTTLKPEDDVATIAWGKGARTPTPEEWLELKNNTAQRWETRGEVAGMVFEGRNGNSIFLPAVGYEEDGYWERYNEMGSYWTNTLGDKGIVYRTSNWDYQIDVDATYGAKCFKFHKYKHMDIDNVVRYRGMPVRAVHPRME